jgi:hypothetical protein
MHKTRSIELVLIGAMFLQIACAVPVPPTVTQQADAAIDPQANFLVLANRQREAVVASLEKVGIKVVSDYSTMNYALEVRLGRSRESKPCGTVHNVSYGVTAFGQRLIIIKGRGATGSCDPNILDDMSRKLVEIID